MRFTFTNTPFQFLLAEASRDLRPRGCAVWFAPGLRRVEHVHVGDGQAVAALYQSSLGTPGGMVDLAYLVVERDGSHTVYEVPSSDCGCIQVPGASWTDEQLRAASDANRRAAEAVELEDRVQRAVVAAFEAEAEAWSLSSDSGDRLARIAARAAVRVFRG